MACFLARRRLASLISRVASSSYTSDSIYSRSRFSIALLSKQLNPFPETVRLPIRWKTSGSGYSPLNDPSPNWSNRPPKETILLDGCDYEHWLIVMEFPDPKPPEEEMINAYVKTLAAVVGSEEEAKKKIYSVCTTTYTGFGALISEELSYKVKELPGVLWVLPDSYLDVPNKDYGGDLFIDGKVIHRPQYWYTDRQQSRNRPRPRYDRRRETRETIQVQRREPMQRESWSQNQTPSPMAGQNHAQVQHSPPMTGQNPAQVHQPPPMTGQNPAEMHHPQQHPSMYGQNPGQIQQLPSLYGQNPGQVQHHPSVAGENLGKDGGRNFSTN